MCTPDAALGSINAGAPLLLMSLRRLTTTFRLTLFFLSPVGDFSCTGVSVLLILR